MPIPDECASGGCLLYSPTSQQTCGGRCGLWRPTTREIRDVVDDERDGIDAEWEDIQQGVNSPLYKTSAAGWNDWVYQGRRS